MATVSSRGFTVIELMLFVAISGALFAGLMLGVNTNIAQQRYRDSVLSYSSLLQNQYSEVLNTRNERTDEWKCTNGVVEPQPNAGDPRGASQCVILGRAIWITDNGSGYQSSPVIGVEPQGQVTPGDLETLAAYKPVLSDSFDTAKGTLDWDSNLVTPQHQPSMASFLILRSPASGLIRVFASNSPLPSDIAAAITTDATTTSITNCVRGQTGLLPVQSVTVDPKIAGPTGIVIKENDPVCA
jgi:type II secretory pathway pseudopilin PulG